MAGGFGSYRFHEAPRIVVAAVINGLKRRAKFTWHQTLASLSRPRWVKRALFADGVKLCILASYSPDGRVNERTVALARGWRRQGFVVLLVVSSDQPRAIAWEASWTDAFDALMVRRNHGYDFGSWADALRALPRHWEPSLLGLANDSVYGPLAGFDDLLARVASSSADVICLTDSFEHTHHIQSYLVFYKNQALRHRSFRRFWSTRWAGLRDDIIRLAELKLLDRMTAGGLRVEALFPASIDPIINPTLQRWRELIAAGFPFVKVQLLRSNPYGVDIVGWDRVLSDGGYDPAIVVRDLGEGYADSAAAGAAHEAGPWEVAA